MAYPTSDWPTSIDAAKTRVDLEVIPADDFNYQDEQIRVIQGFLGENGDLIGDDGVASHGPGGLLSPVATGGTAIQLAARADYTTGKILSVGDNYDTSYAEKLFMAASGVLDVSGVTDYETLVTGDDHIPNKKYVDDAITASIPAAYWTKSGTVVEVLTSGDTIEVGNGTTSQPGYRFNGDTNTGIYSSGAGHVNFTLNGAEGLDVTSNAMWKLGSQEQQLFLFREYNPGDGADIAEIQFASFDTIFSTVRYSSIQGYIIDESNPERAGGMRIFCQDIETVPVIDIHRDLTNLKTAVLALKRGDDHADDVDVGIVEFWGTGSDGSTLKKYAEIAGICDADGAGEGDTDGSIALRVDDIGTLSDRLIVNGDSAKGNVAIWQDDAIASLHTYRTSSMSSGDIVFIQKFFGVDSGTAEEQYAQIEIVAVDTTAANPDGRIDFLTDVAGTMTDQISIGPGLSVGPTGTVLPPGAGSVNISGSYEVDNVQVLTNRISGWTAPSGTADRSGYNADGPPTITEVGQALKALIDDLFTHGVIGGSA